MIKNLVKFALFSFCWLFLSAGSARASLFGPSEKEKKIERLSEEYEPCQNQSYLESNMQRCEAIANELRELTDGDGGETAANVREFEEKCSGANWSANAQRCQELSQQLEKSQQDTGSGGTGSSGLVASGTGQSGNTASSGGSSASGSTSANTGNGGTGSNSGGTSANTGDTSVQTGSGGTSVNTGDTSVQTGSGGTSVNTGDASVQTGNGGEATNSGGKNVRIWYSGIDGLGNLLADSESNPELKQLMDTKWGQASRYYVANGKTRMPTELVADLANIGIRVDLSMREKQLIESQGSKLFGMRGGNAGTVQGAGESSTGSGTTDVNSSANSSPCSDYWYRSYHPQECANYQSGGGGDSAGTQQQTTASSSSQNAGTASQSGTQSGASQSGTESQSATGTTTQATAQKTSFIGPDSSSSAYEFGGQAGGVGGVRALGGMSSTGGAAAPAFFGSTMTSSGGIKTFYSYVEIQEMMGNSSQSPSDEEASDEVNDETDNENNDEDNSGDQEEESDESGDENNEDDEDESESGGTIGDPVTLGLSVQGVYFRQYGSDITTINFTRQIGNEISVSDFTSSNPFLGGIYASANTDFFFRAIADGILSVNPANPAPKVIFADNSMLTDNFTGYPSTFDPDSGAVILGQSYFEGKTQQLALSAMIHEFVHSQQDPDMVSTLSSYYGPDGRFATNELLSDPTGAFLEGTAMLYQAYYYPERWNQHQFGLARCGFIREDSGSSISFPKYNSGINRADLSCSNALSYKNLNLSDFEQSPAVLANILMEFMYRAPKVASGAQLGEGIVNQAIKEAFLDGTSTPTALLSKIGDILSSSEPMSDKYGNQLTEDELKSLRLSFAIILDVMTNFTFEEDMAAFKEITGTTDDDLTSYLTAYPTSSPQMQALLDELEDAEPEVYERLNSRTSASHRDLLKAIVNKTNRNGTQLRFNGFEALDGLPVLSSGSFAVLALPRLDGTSAIARGLYMAGVDYQNTDSLSTITEEPSSYSPDGAFINRPF